MMSRPYAVYSGARLMLLDAGLDPARVLERAKLPADLYTHERTMLDADAYFRMWRAIEAEGNDPTLPIRLGSAISVEAFDPVIFAAFSSPDLNTALHRVARYKPLFGPMTLTVNVGRSKTTMQLVWAEATQSLPPTLVLTKLVFFVRLARMAKRERITPIETRSPILPQRAQPYTRFFGLPVKKGRSIRHVFRAEDAGRAFLTVNRKMWEVFEPDLRQRLSQVEGSASTAERVRSILLEMLPGGSPSMEAVAQQLGLSSRTLQRRLRSEQAGYQRILSQTREELARHYLANTDLPGAEISYLLGYEDPNCFFRAYQGWTGTCPAKARAVFQSRQ